MEHNSVWLKNLLNTSLCMQYRKRFCKNDEAFASEFVEKSEELFPRYCWRSDIDLSLKTVSENLILNGRIQSLIEHSSATYKLSSKSLHLCCTVLYYKIKTINETFHSNVNYFSNTVRQYTIVVFICWYWMLQKHGIL